VCLLVCFLRLWDVCDTATISSSLILFLIEGCFFLFFPEWCFFFLYVKFVVDWRHFFANSHRLLEG